MFDSMNNREELQKDLRKSLTLAKNEGRKLAQAERDYKVANAKLIAKLKAEGERATLILEICKGDPEVAKLRFERDMARVMYKVSLEAINIFKQEIKIIQDDITNERRGM